MIAVLKKELSLYLHTTLGVIFVSIFMIFASYYFLFYNILSNSSDLGMLFQTMLMTLVFLVPVLTMRLLSEEKKTKSDQILLTSPVSVTSIIIGKYLSAVIVFLISVFMSLIFAYIVFVNGNPEPGVIFTVYIGFIIIGAVFIAIGLFISALTESQVIAAIFTFGILLFIQIADSLRGSISNQAVVNFLKWSSLTERYKSFCMGILDISDILYLISIAVLFVFLTIRVIEKRRWS